MHLISGRGNTVVVPLSYLNVLEDSNLARIIGFLNGAFIGQES